ncbi:ABC transporter ATP-binding protein [Sinomonas atrocyanea]|uniref:ABC transporter ATP-binding protein n=1 Tax=Sinomonas atrocyanea TaxID=37927 RepID=UPI003D98F5DF
MEVTVRGLELRYGSHAAIQDLDLTIPDGESLVLLGQSGCGKTSTMRSIAGLETPTAGTIAIGDRVVFDGAAGKSVPAFRRNVGMVFQSYAVWPHKSVLENVAFPLKMKGASRQQQRTRALEVLETVGLAHLADRGASMLSGGQMQRVALARSMAMAPSVLLLDEPLSNLDARLRDDLRVELRRIQLEKGLTSLYVTHDQQEALALADRIAIMQSGRITQLGTPQSIYRTPASASIASFLGVTNVFPLEDQTHHGLLKVRGHDVALRASRTSASTPASVCLRPEDIRIEEESRTGQDSVNTFSALLEVAVFQGASLRCRLSLLPSGLSLDALVPSEAAAGLAPGSRVRVRVDPDNVLVLPDDVSQPTEQAVAA